VASRNDRKPQNLESVVQYVFVFYLKNQARSWRLARIRIVSCDKTYCSNKYKFLFAEECQVCARIRGLFHLMC
jgi:hypothetical protein